MSEMQSPSPAQPAGALTAVMRSATPKAASKVLRVGLVHKGKVIDERILGEGDHVTIGPNERATFVVQSSTLPPSFRLFEHTREGYALQVTPHMAGRVAQKAGVCDLTVLRSNARVVQLAAGLGAAHAIPLTDDARGKVTIGELTVLFQFVTPAPSLGKPQLPASVKSGMGDVDVRTSVIAAFSFLLHFGAVGSIYSDWMDPVVDDEAETTQILESVKQLPPPPPIEHPKLDPVAPASSTSAAPVAKTQTPASGGQGGARGGAAGNGGAGAGDARAHQISSQLASMELQVLTALNSGGSATSAVLDGAGNLPLGMLDKAAASANGAREGGFSGLDLGARAGAPMRPGAIPRSPIPGDPGPLTPMGPGSAPPVKPPPGNVAVPGPTQSGGNVPNAAAVVAGMTPGFRRCYNNGINHEDPNMKGSVRITARIGPNGEVLSASASGSGTVSATVVGCMRARVASAQFAAPEGGGATLIIPVIVSTQ